MLGPSATSDVALLLPFRHQIDDDYARFFATADGGEVCMCPHPPSDRLLIRWKRFLLRRSLHVLLVEHDDSMHHVIAALLRKCSYHVARLEDGMKAWEVRGDDGEKVHYKKNDTMFMSPQMEVEFVVH